MLLHTVSAQHETLFGNARVVGGFGGPIFEFGVSNDIPTGIGGGGGVVIENFFIGGYGMGALDYSVIVDDNLDIDQVELAHGGLWLGYSYKTYAVIHPYVSTRLGWGAVNIQFDQPGSSFSDLDRIMAFTPEIGAELNVARWFRIYGTFGYRLVWGTQDEIPDYTDQDFRGWMAGLGFRFGWFGNRRP
jgi:hypothetical protein